MYSRTRSDLLSVNKISLQFGLVTYIYTIWPIFKYGLDKTNIKTIFSGWRKKWRLQCVNKTFLWPRDMTHFRTWPNHDRYSDKVWSCWCSFSHAMFINYHIVSYKIDNSLSLLLKLLNNHITVHGSLTYFNAM